MAFRYETGLPPGRWSVRACQCAFCRKHDALSVSDPAGRLAFSATDPAAPRRYRFGLRTADFILCRHCGVYAGAVIDTGRGLFGIINLHALDDGPGGFPDAEPIRYDGETAAGRTRRRAERWTPVTALPWH